MRQEGTLELEGGQPGQGSTIVKSVYLTFTLSIPLVTKVEPLTLGSVLPRWESLPP